MIADLHVQFCSIGQLIPYCGNPRTHSYVRLSQWDIPYSDLADDSPATAANRCTATLIEDMSRVP